MLVAFFDFVYIYHRIACVDQKSANLHNVHRDSDLPAGSNNRKKMKK